MNESKLIAAFYIILIVGVAGHFIGEIFEIMLYITPVALLIMGLMMIIASGLFRNKKFIIWFILLYILTLTVEIIGVNTGKIFGEYNYGNVLGYKLFGVPVIIGFNWMLVILGAVNIALKFSSKVIVICLISSLLAVLFDIVLEPVAMNFNYWEWKDNIIPFQNYLAWFIISFLIPTSIFIFKINIYSGSFIHYFIGLFIFFSILNFK